jgi:hypothetical protein
LLLAIAAACRIRLIRLPTTEMIIVAGSGDCFGLELGRQAPERLDDRGVADVNCTGQPAASLSLDEEIV